MHDHEPRRHHLSFSTSSARQKRKKISKRKRHGNFLTKSKGSEAETCLQVCPKKDFKGFKEDAAEMTFLKAERWNLLQYTIFQFRSKQACIRSKWLKWSVELV